MKRQRMKYSAACARRSFLSVQSERQWPTKGKFLRHLKIQPQAYTCLEDIQIDLKMPAKCPKQDVQVRRRSTHNMMQNPLEQKGHLSVFLSDRNLPATLTASWWSLMDKTAEVLDFFEKVSEHWDCECSWWDPCHKGASNTLPFFFSFSFTALTRESIAGTLLQAADRCFSQDETEPLPLLWIQDTKTSESS